LVIAHSKRITRPSTKNTPEWGGERQGMKANSKWVEMKWRRSGERCKKEVSEPLSAGGFVKGLAREVGEIR